MESDSFDKQFVTFIATDSPPDWLRGMLQNNAALALTMTAQETVSALMDRQFNLIIIDDALNAMEIMAKAKAAFSFNAHTPFLALVGEIGYGQRKSLIASGFDDCLKKPLSINSLDEAIAFWHGDYSPYSYLDSIQKLLRNCRNNHKLATTLYNKLFTTLPEQVRLIETAIKYGNYQLALDTAHSLNGSVKTCFLQPMVPIANTLENALVEKKQELVEDCFLQLKQKIKAFIEQREEILSYLETLPKQ